MISLLVVNFRSASLAAGAVESARRASSAPLEVVLVDNSCDPAEAEALRRFADVLVVADRNSGYAGGINEGRPHCSGEKIVICNPDVEFGPGSIDRLSESLEEAEVAGPALSWDSAGEWMLPPGDVTTVPEKFDVILSSRSRTWRAQRDRRRTRRRIAFWSLERTTPVPTLSGAVLAIRTADLERFDGFDERFRLYFEETDFLRRVRAGRGRVVYVPSARCRHLYNQSAGQIAAESAERYAESELKYLEKWNGPFLARAMKRLERPLEDDVYPPVRWPIEPAGEELLVEVSPLASFSTAAGHFLREPLAGIPREIRDSVRQRPLSLRIVDRKSAEVLATYSCE